MEEKAKDKVKDARTRKSKEQARILQVLKISIDDLQKIDLRVAKVVEAEKVEGLDNFWLKLEVKETRQVVSEYKVPQPR